MKKAEPKDPGLIVIEKAEEKGMAVLNEINSAKALTYANRFAPFMEAANQAIAYLSGLNTEVPTKEDAKTARTTRLALVKQRTASKEIKAELKAGLIVETRLIDGLFNVVESTLTLAESDLEKIENFEANRLKKEREERRAERELVLAPYEINTAFYDLENMDEATFDDLVDREDRAKTARDQERAEAEERARIASEQAEKERENNLVLSSRINMLSTLGLHYVPANKAYEGFSLAIAEEFVKGASFKDFDRTLKEITVSVNEARQRIQDERDAAEKTRIENQRLTDERNAKQAEELRKATNEKNIFARKLQEQKDAEIKEANDRAKAERDAKLAPDKEKLRIMFESLKSFPIPEFQGEECKKIAFVVDEALKELRKFVVKESQKLV